MRGIIKALSISEANQYEVIYFDLFELLRYFISLISEVCVPQCSDVSFETTFKASNISFFPFSNVYHLFFFKVCSILDLRIL